MFPITFLYEYEPFLDPLLNSKLYIFLEFPFVCGSCSYTFINASIFPSCLRWSHKFYSEINLNISCVKSFFFPSIFCVSKKRFDHMASAHHYSHSSSMYVYVCLDKLGTIWNRDCLFHELTHMLISAWQICSNLLNH